MAHCASTMLKVQELARSTGCHNVHKPCAQLADPQHHPITYPLHGISLPLLPVFHRTPKYTFKIYNCVIKCELDPVHYYLSSEIKTRIFPGCRQGLRSLTGEGIVVPTLLCLWPGFCPSQGLGCWLEVWTQHSRWKPLPLNNDQETQLTYFLDLCSSWAAFPHLVGMHMGQQQTTGGSLHLAAGCSYVSWSLLEREFLPSWVVWSCQGVIGCLLAAWPLALHKPPPPPPWGFLQLCAG